MSGESDEAHLSLLLCFRERLGRSARPNKKFRIVIETNPVYLPKVEVVSLQSVQRLFQHLHRQRPIPSMCADLRHQKHPIAFTFETPAQPIFRLAAEVFPAVVEEGDSAIDCFID